MQTPFVKETELKISADRVSLKEKLLHKLSAQEIEPLKNSKRFKELYDKVYN